jgi:hypothetical protein
MYLKPCPICGENPYPCELDHKKCMCERCDFFCHIDHWNNYMDRESPLQERIADLLEEHGHRRVDTDETIMIMLEKILAQHTKAMTTLDFVEMMNRHLTILQQPKPSMTKEGKIELN